jgi:hypothetical protein
LVKAAAKQSLPDDYTDVTEGFLASWKRRLKRKLLGNFKHAYVDVLARQQSAFNRYLLTALQEVAECCALLDHARRTGEGGKIAVTDGPVFLASAIENAVTAGGADDLAVLLHKLLEELADSRTRSAGLEERLRRLETRLTDESKSLP